MKFRRQTSIQSWIAGPVIAASGLILSLWLDAPPLLSYASLALLMVSMLAVEWMIAPNERALFRRVTFFFRIQLFHQKYEISDRHRLHLILSPKGTKTRDGDFITDYAELELEEGDSSISLAEGSDVAAVSRIADLVSSTLFIEVRKN